MGTSTPWSGWGAPLDESHIAAMFTSIGGQVRETRRRRSWYLSDLAVRVDVSESVVCRLELARREPSFHQLVMACAALEMRPSGVVRLAEDEAFPLGDGPWTG